MIPENSIHTSIHPRFAGSVRSNLSWLAVLLSVSLALTVLGRPVHGAGTSQPARTHEVHFKAGKLIEVIYHETKAEGEARLDSEFDPALRSLITEYGGQRLADFQTLSVAAGDLRASRVQIVEWASYDQLFGMLEDSRFKAIEPIHDGATAGLTIGFYTVPKDVTATFSEDKVYEFAAARWVSDDPEVVQQQLAPKLGQYFENVGPLLDTYGARVVVRLTPDPNSPDMEWVYKPQIALIGEWDSPYSQTRLFADPEYKKQVALREQAAKDLDSLHSRIMFR